MAQIRYFFAEGNYISKVEDEVFGSFIEHLGRAVYSGIRYLHRPLPRG